MSVCCAIRKDRMVPSTVNPGLGNFAATVPPPRKLAAAAASALKGSVCGAVVMPVSCLL
jgi:hypothetical protein